MTPDAPLMPITTLTHERFRIHYFNLSQHTKVESGRAFSPQDADNNVLSMMPQKVLILQNAFI